MLKLENLTKVCVCVGGTIRGRFGWSRRLKGSEDWILKQLRFGGRRGLQGGGVVSCRWECPKAEEKLFFHGG